MLFSVGVIAGCSLGFTSSRDKLTWDLPQRCLLEEEIIYSMSLFANRDVGRSLLTAVSSQSLVCQTPEISYARKNAA